MSFGRSDRDGGNRIAMRLQEPVGRQKKRVMSELQNYTDEQLRDELKRRAKERRANTPREIIYKEFEATICEVLNVKQKYNGHTSYLPFEQWSFKVDDITSDLARLHYKDVFKLARGVFKKSNAPKVGDRVKLRYRRRKKRFEVVDIDKARIVEVVWRNQ